MSDQPRVGTVQATVNAILNTVARRALPVVLLLILAYLVWLARDALAPYLMGLLIIYILLPVVHKIEHWLPFKGKYLQAERPIAAFAAIALAAVLIFGIMYVLVDPLVSQTTILITEVGNYINEVESSDQGWQEMYNSRVPEAIRTWIETNIEGIGNQALSGSMGVAEWFLNFTGSIVSSLLALVAVPLFIIFYMIDEKTTPSALRRQLPLPWAEDIVAIFRIADRILGSYTRAVLVQAAIIATVTAAGYWVIGIDMALPLGIIAGAGAIVPIVGLWLALLVTLPILLVTQFDHTLLAVLVYFGVQIISGWVLMPKIQGDSVDFTVTGVLLIIAVAGAIAGPLGLIFALPVAAVVRAAAVYTYHRLQGASPEASIRQLRLFQTEKDAADASILRGDDPTAVPASTAPSPEPAATS